jgi:CheY-like chemotaxis protein
MSGGPAVTETVLVVEGDILARHAIAQYLRHCGYLVIEAASGEEGITLLSQADIQVNVVLSAVELRGAIDGFTLAKWLRANRSGVDVVLAGTISKAAKEAGDLCEEGLHLKRPYDTQQVLDWIRKLKNLRAPGRMGPLD